MFEFDRNRTQLSTVKTGCFVMTSTKLMKNKALENQISCERILLKKKE